MNNYLVFKKLFSCPCIYHKICLKIFSKLSKSLLRKSTYSRYSINFTFLKTPLLVPLTCSTLRVYPLSLLNIWQPGISSLILQDIFFASLLCWIFVLPYSMSFSFLIYSLFWEETIQKLPETEGDVLLGNFACLTWPFFYSDTGLIV